MTFDPKSVGFHNTPLPLQPTLPSCFQIPYNPGYFASPGLPHSFTSNIDAVVMGGVLISANFSATDGDYSIRLNSAYFSLANFSQSYIYDGNVTFAPLGSGDPQPVADSGAATCILLGVGLVAVGCMRSQLVR